MNTDDSRYMVVLKGLAKKFGKIQAVQKLDLSIPASSFVTLLGPSGCGKTTILRMIAGLEHPSEGEIYINGVLINDVPVHKRNLGMIFQNYALFPHKTIFDNVAFGLKYRNVSKEVMDRKVKDALDMVRLPGVEKRKPSELSGGQQQRIALARAIVIEPDVLLMDEPLSALDENLREEMRREIDNIQQLLKVTTIFVTHDQREALSMSDRIVVMKDGYKQQEGSPEDVYDQPVNHFVADFLGHSNFLNGTVTGHHGNNINVKLENGGEVTVEQRIAEMETNQVDVVVRAQKVHLSRESHNESFGGLNCLPGQIDDVCYMGGEIRYTVVLDNDTMISVITTIKSKSFRAGDRIVAHFKPEDCQILPSGD